VSIHRVSIEQGVFQVGNDKKKRSYDDERKFRRKDSGLPLPSKLYALNTQQTAMKPGRLPTRKHINESVC
jgi:hypothetical protein